MLKMTITCPDTSLRVTTPQTQSCRNDGVIQLDSLSSDAIFEVIEISDACFAYILFQYAPHAAVNRIQIQRIWRPQ